VAASLVNSVNVNVGGAMKTINPGDLVTPAEFVAAYQVMSGGAQRLHLGADGNAVAGRMSLTGLGQIGDLVVPASVRVLQDFSSSQLVNLAGNLTNAGKFVAFSNMPQVNTGELSANNITNSGTVASYLASFTMSALGNLVNTGTVTGTGNLTMSAGGTLTNTGLVSAGGDLNMLTANVVNSGLLQSLNGNINLNTVTASNIMVNNIGGTFEALKGAINVRDLASTDLKDLTMVGGNYLSKELNLNSCGGTVELRADDLTGVLNIKAAVAHTFSSTDTLTLGNLDLTGDPTFYNLGNININGLVSVGEDLAIVAEGNVTATSATAKLVANDGSNGAQILVLAGVDIDTTNCPSCVMTLEPGFAAPEPFEVASGESIDVDLAGGTGGNINFTASTEAVVIDASAVAADSSGGLVILGAHQVAGTGGQVLLPGTGSVNANAIGTGTNGEVRIFAGANSGTGISLGSVSATGGSGGGGTIEIATAQPVTSDSNPLTLNDLGQITSGNDVEAGALTNSNIVRAGGTITPGSNLLLDSGAGAIGSAGSRITFNAPGVTLVNTAGNVFLNSIGTDVTLVSSTGASFQMISSGDINVNGSLTASNVLTLQTLAGSNGDISFNADASGANGISITTDGTGDAYFGGGITVSTTNSPITVVANDFELAASDFLDAGTGTVTLRPNGNKSISVGGAGGTFVISQAELNNITASNLVIGSTANSGNVTIAGNVDVSALYNLTVNNLGNYVGTGFTLTTGSNDLTVNAANINTGEIDGSAGGGTVVFNANGDINVDAFVNAGLGGTLTLTTVSGSNGNITFNGFAAGQDVTVSADGSGDISRNSGTIIATNALTLTSGSGDIGPSGSDLDTDTATLFANTTGNVNIDNTGGGLNLGASTGAAFRVSANGGIDLVDTLTATSSVELSTQAGSNGSIDFAGNINAVGGSVTLSADGTGSITRTSGTISTSTLDMTAGGVIGSMGSNILTSATTLTANTSGGDVFVTGSSPIALGMSSANNFNLTTTGAITVTAPVTAGLDLNLTGAGITTQVGANLDGNNVTLMTTSNGAITLNDDINAGTAITLNASGSGTIDQNAGSLNTLDLSLISGSANITGINTNAVTLDASTTGDVDLTTSGPTTLLASTGNNFTLAAAGNLTVNGLLNATGDVDLSTTASNGSLQLNANVNGDNIALTAIGSGNIAQANTGLLLNTPGALDMTSGTGNIGTALVPIQTNASAITASTSAPGSVWINSQNTNPIDIGPMSGFDLVFDGAGTINVVGALSFTNTVDIANTAGDIAIGADIGLNGVTASVMLDAFDNITRNSGTVYGNGVTLTAGTGSIGANVIGERVLVESSAFGLTITANSGSAYVDEETGAILNASSVSAAGDLFLRNLGSGQDIMVDGLVTGGQIHISTFGGAGSFIDLDADITATNEIQLDAGENITRTSGTLTAPDVTLIAQTGDIGGIGNEVVVDAGFAVGKGLAITATTGSAYVYETDGLNLKGSSADGNLFVTQQAAGEFNVTGDVSADDVQLTMFNNGGTNNLVLSGNVTGDTNVILTADDGITRTGAFTVTSANLDLTATNGSIGTAGMRILTAGNPDADLTLSTVNNAYIEHTNGAGGELFIQPVVIAGDLFISTLNAGNMTVDGTLFGNDIRLTTFATGGGTIDLDGSLNGATQVVLSADGSITRSSGTITTGLLDATATTGNIGANVAGERLVTALGTLPGQGLTVSAPAGSAYVEESDGIRINASTTLNDFFVSTTGAVGTIDVVGVIQSGDVQFTTFATGGGNINLDANVTGNSQVVLTADNSINRTSGTVTGGVVSLTATTGDVGDFGGGEIRTNAGHAMGEGLDVHAPNGNAYIFELNSVRINASNVLTNFYLDTQTAGAVTITVVGAVTGSDIRFNNSIGANINLLNSITGGNILVLNAGGSITNTVGATSLLSADLVQLIAEQSIGANVAGEEIYTNAAATAGNGLEMRAVNGSMYIKEADSVRIRLAENTSFDSDVHVDVIGAGGTMTLDNAADRVFGGAIRLTTIDGPGGDILLGSGTGNVNGATSVFMHAGFNLDDTAGGSIVAPSIDLEAAVDIGSGAFRILTNAGAGVGEGLSVSAGNGSAWILESDAVNVKASVVNGTNGQFLLDQNAAGNLNVVGAVDGHDIQFTTFTGGGSDINLDASITVTVAGALIDLTADGSITRSAGTLTSAEDVMLTATTGSIGTGANHISVDADAAVGNGITATADDNVFIDSTGNARFQTSVATTGQFLATADGSLTAEGTITAGTTVDLSTNSGSDGAITLDESVLGGGTVTISADGTGNFTLAAAKSVTSGGNPINIFANDVIFGGVGSAIDALGSQVTLSPNGDGKSIEVAGAGGATFNVSSAELANIRAGILQIGDTDFDGGFTVAGGIDVTGAGPFGVYNLQFYNGGNYTAVGQSILTGIWTLDVTALGTVNTGTVTGTTGNILITAGDTLTVSGDLFSGGGSVLQLITNDNNGAIALDANVTAGLIATITADGSGDISQTATKSVTAPTLNISSGSGVIGSNQSIDFTSDFFQANSSGDVNLNSIGTTLLQFDGVSSGANFTLTTAGDVQTSGENITATDELTITTTANNGYIVFTGASGTISGTNGVFLTTDGTGLMGVGDGLTVSSTAGPIVITANNVDLQPTGFVNAGNGQVTLRPNGVKSIEVAGAGAATFNLSTAEMANITAGTLQVGTTTQAGGFTVAGGIDVSGAGPAGVYNLVFENGGSYTGTGFTITLGSKDLTVTALGTANTGTVTSSAGGDITFTAGGLLTVDGDLTTTGAGVTSLSTSLGSGASIALDNNVGGGAITNVDADGAGNITQAASKLVSGTSVNLTSGSGDIGGVGTEIQTQATNLTVNTFMLGEAYVNNAASGINLGLSNGNTLVVTAGGTITTTALVSGDFITLEANSGSGGGITLGDDVDGSDSVTLNADGAGNIDGNGNNILTTTLDMNSGSGNIGTALDPILTNADFVTTSTTGEVHVVITGSTQIGPADGSVLSFSATDGITTGGAIVATDTLTIKTTANDGSITISNDASGVNGVTIQTNGTGNFTVDSAATVSSSAADVSIEANDVDLSAGFVTAGNTVTLFPNGTKSITVGSAGGTFNVLQADLNVITATTLEIGKLTVGGNLTIGGAVSISALTYDMHLHNGGNYIGTGQTITTGVRDLHVEAVGTINTGSVTATSGEIFFESLGTLTLDGNATTTGAATLQTTVASNADVALGANLGGGTTTTINVHGTGNITRTAGSLNGATVSLDAEDGNIGGVLVANRINTQADQLLLDSEGGNVFVINTGDVVIGSGSAGDGKTFSVEAQSGIDIQANIAAQGLGDVIGLISLKASGSDDITNTGGNTLTADAVELETVNGDIGGFFTPILTDTDSLKLTSTAGGAFVINDGSLTLQASTIGGDLFLITAGGGITTGGDINAANLFFDGTSLVNANTITATGGGTFEMISATNLTVSGGGTITATGGVTMSAIDNTLSFTGNQTFNGNTTLNATDEDGLVSVDAGISVNSNDDLTISACMISNPPPGFTADGALIFNFTCAPGGGTIANSDGDVILPSNLVILGSSVAIIASGNVISEGATLINLSSTTAQGGNLNIVAGFDFLPATVGQVTDTTTTFTLGSASATGGSVFLGGVNIQTNSTSAGFAGGSVTIIAHAGTESRGEIEVGSVNASAVGNPGGTVLMIGQGGVEVGGDINTVGSQGGSVTIVGAEPEISGGSVEFNNGIRSGTGMFTSPGPVSGVNAGVFVDGDIDATGLQGNGGTVVVAGDIALFVDGSITANGGTAGGHGGNVEFGTINGRLTVSGGISALGGSNNTALAAGNGGVLFIDVPAFATIGGNVLLSGGNNTSTGNAGVGGDFLAITELNTLGITPRVFRIGTIVIGGFADLQGGDSTGGNGGAGGDLIVDAGAFRVVADNGGVSINTSAGTGGTPGANGFVDINTYSLQQLPINFMLTSLNLSEIALAGGMFNVGDGTVNGTAGTIVSGGDSATAGNAGRIINTNPFSLGNIEIDVTGPSNYTINLGGTPTVFSVDAGVGTPRTMVTPGEALALYQVSRDSNANAQTIGLERKGKVTDKNPVTGLSPSVITINSQELPAQFTSFVVNTQANRPGLTINMQGASSVINVANPGAGGATNWFYINGDLIFTTADSTVEMNIGSNIFNMSKDGSFTQNGTSSLAIFTGDHKTWTAQGTMTSGTFVFDGSSHMTFDMGTTGTLNGTGAGSTVNFLAGGNMQVKGGLKTNALVGTSLGDLSANGTLAWTASGDLVIADGALLETAGLMTIQPSQTGADVIFGDGAMAASGAGITVKATDITTGDDVTMIAGGGDLFITSSANNGDVTIGFGNTLVGGTLSGLAPPPPTILTNADIVAFGGVFINAWKQNGVLTINSSLANPTTITSNGRDVSLIGGKTPTLTFGDSMTVQANGGNVILVGGATVTGGSGNTFIATAIGNLNAFTGGGVEIGAGETTSKNLVNTLKNRPLTFTTVPNPLPAIGTFNLVPPVPTRGVLRADIKAPGVINIGTGVNPATLEINGGVIIFDGNKQNLTIVGPTIQVNAPVSFTNESQSQGELMVDTGDDCDQDIEDGTVSILP
jgi:hypothetical protein